jgi:hypothetical protein
MINRKLLFFLPSSRPIVLQSSRPIVLPSSRPTVLPSYSLTVSLSLCLLFSMASPTASSGAIIPFTAFRTALLQFFLIQTELLTTPGPLVPLPVPDIPPIF